MTKVTDKMDIRIVFAYFNLRFYI